uniref:Nebulette n=1 Tax=Bos mutus grunniens TaxID=30521 RepID=A0A8B9YBC6_BOSMU
MRVPVFEDVFFKPVIEDLSMELARRCTELISDIHYKEDVFAREVTQLQSEIAYRQKHDAAKGVSDYAHMKEPPEIKHAMEVNKHQSNVSKTPMYNAELDRPDIKMAEYKKGQGVMNKEPAVIGRPDFEHAVEASKLSSQIKYKEKFDSEMKDKKHLYNPLESASFRQSQLATALASNVKYKKDIQNMHDPVSGLPNLFLDHALKVSKMLSGKGFEENKGLYHFDVDAAEHLHHKGNAMLQSQVKYKEEYEKNKGNRWKSMLEFVETPSYQVSKEAQKMQSEKVYREDFEKDIKGRSSMDLDKTQSFYIHDLDIKNDIKFYFLQKDYKRDLETEIRGKGMQVSTDTLDIQRAKKASEMASQKEYKKDLENEIKGKGMQVSMDIPDMLRAKRASEIYSQVEKYKDEAEKMLSSYSTVADTPEIQRIKTTQQNISAVFYKKEVGAGTAVKDTPEIERVKKNQQNISSVKYKEEVKHATAISDPPELKRVKENQKNISNLRYKEPCDRATPVSMTPEIERVRRNQEQLSTQVKYRGEIKQATAISDPPELKRVKENQKNLSNVYYKSQMGRATALSVTPEMERVKKNQENISSVNYTQDQKQMKGRPSLILDTPGLRHVKEAQNRISMVKYHEDFEKTKGRGFTPVVDDPVTERVRRNTQVVSDAAYKGVHPHIVEMDRRPGIIVDLKVWRTDPGSIFDIDPLEDNIQSRSLHMLSEKANLYRRQRSRSYSSSTFGTGLGDDKSEISEIYRSFSCCSEVTRPSDEGAPVLPGAYQQSHSQGYAYMHQTSLSSVRSMQHSPNLRTYRAMYDYSAQDEDEVSFRDGDYIVNVQPIDDGWMYANYIEFVN